MQPSEYEIMFRMEETHWWYRALHRLIFDTSERELPEDLREDVMNLKALRALADEQ